MLHSSRLRQAREEAKLQRRCVKRLRARYPHACTYRGDGGQQLQAGMVAYRLARLEGRMAGAPDLLILLMGLNGGPLQVEFKSQRGRLSQAQKDWHNEQRAQGFNVVVVRTDAQFDAALDEHMGVGAGGGGALPLPPSLTSRLVRSRTPAHPSLLRARTLDRVLALCC